MVGNSNSKTTKRENQQRKEMVITEPTNKMDRMVILKSIKKRDSKGMVIVISKSTNKKDSNSNSRTNKEGEPKEEGW